MNKVIKRENKPCKGGKSSNTGVWTLDGALLILNFLNTNEQTTAAERHWIVEGAPELNLYTL